MESEFIALDKAGEEAEWLRNFLEDIPYWPKLVAPVCIHCDSQAAIGRAGSMMYNGKSRHIHRRYNTIRELLFSGIITIDYVKSKDNVSDPLTKGLHREGVERTSKGMGLRPRTSQHGDCCFYYRRLLCFRLLLLLQKDALFQIVASITEDCTASESCNSSTEKTHCFSEPIETLKKALANKKSLTPQTNKPKEASRTPFQKAKATTELQEGYDVTKLYDQAGNDSFMKTPPSPPFAFRSQDTPQTPAFGLKYQQASRSPTSGFKSQQPPRSPTSGFKSQQPPRSPTSGFKSQLLVSNTSKLLVFYL
ncbi:hypothetical protein CQW23_33004 [Capsicum baccatum]|uniref:Uncharacterized protein n=1 Tax=Capsicum baccatum TaxID=33114 RepID=A0A2G2V324_CAPBA|nr:hypothetical protein CQW23_33004 [Capsicum baccatum]